MFQPRKVQRSGLWHAIEQRVRIYLRKEQMVDDVKWRCPARHYVMVDDKLPIMAAMSKVCGDRLATVCPGQGHYAFGPRNIADDQLAAITIERIDELINYHIPTLLGTADAGPANEGPRSIWGPKERKTRTSWGDESFNPWLTVEALRLETE
ncbi:MAG: hypothetical protein ACLPXB_04140 [Thiobacillaceae bacterium]